MSDLFDKEAKSYRSREMIKSVKYQKGLEDGYLVRFNEKDGFSHYGIIICESPLDQEMPEMAAPYCLHRTYRYGKIKVTTYHREEDRQA